MMSRIVHGMLALVVATTLVSCKGSKQGVETDPSANPFTPTEMMPSTFPATSFSPTAPHWTDPAFDPEAPLPFDPHVRQGSLPNGLRWFVRTNTEPEDRAELRLVVNAGSVLEEDDQQGLAHFLEHMAFNGTENFEKQELVDYLERVGMKFGPEINAYTSFDETVYMLTVPTDTLHVLQTGVEVLAEWSRRITLDPEEVTKERGVVLEEWRLRQGAGQRLQDETLPVVYHDSRYAERLPIGKPEIIETATPEPLRRFYQQWYRPDLMTVIAVGDFDPGHMIDLIRKNFGEDWGPAQPAERTVYDIPEHETTLVKIATDPEMPRTSASITVKGPLHRTEKVGDLRRDVLESLFTQMFNARLSERLRKENPPFLGAFAGAGQMGRTRGSLRLGVSADDGKVLPALEYVLLEAKRVKEAGFTPTEFDRAKENFGRAVRERYTERENLPSRAYASVLAAHALEDAPMPGAEFRYEHTQRLLPTLTLEEVNALEFDFLQEANRVVTVTGPDKPEAPMPTEDELFALFEAVGQKSLEPYVDDVSDDPLIAAEPKPGSVTKTREVPEVGITEWTLANGVRVLAKPTDFKADEIVMSAYSWGGRSLGTLDRDLSLDFASFMVNMGGLAQFDVPQLQKKLAGKQVNVDPYISTYEEGLSGSASPEDLETLLQLSHLYFTSPRRDGEAFRALQQRYSAFLKNRDLDPATAYRDTLNVTRLNRHPWSKPMTSQDVEELDLDRGLEFYRERFADAGDFVFFFVGNLDLAQLRSLCETYLGSLPSLEGEENWRDTGIRMPEGPVHKVVQAGVAEKAQTTLFWDLPLREWSRAERHRVSTLGQMLNTRLREVIREDLSGSYGVRVGMSAQQQPYEHVSMSISFGCDPERLGDLVNEVQAVLETIAEKGFESSYLEKAKEAQRRDFQEGREQNGYWISSMEIRDKWGLPQEDVLQTEAVIEALDLETVNDTAAHYLREGHGPVPNVRVDWVPASQS